MNVSVIIGGLGGKCSPPLRLTEPFWEGLGPTMGNMPPSIEHSHGSELSKCFHRRGNRSTGPGQLFKKRKKAPRSKTNILCMLLPWISFWIFPLINFYYGSLFCLAVCVFLPLLLFQNKKTIYDIISGTAVGAFSIGLLLEASIINVIPLSYLVFGAMWSVSAFIKVPITAEYPLNNHGGETAYCNPAFIRANRIISAAWGILYLLMAVGTYIIMRTSLWVYFGVINFLLPALMGIFTVCFQKRYPK